MAEKKAWVLRPLLWWLLLVAVLFAAHRHQQLLEQTRLYFSISLNGQPLPYPVAATSDGRPINNGDRISLGNHHFEIVGSKTTSFTTNLSIWYGRHDLGDIALKRSMGTLSVKADPAPLSIAINGSEFSTNIQDSSGIDLILPTDSYYVSAQYRRWSDTRTVTVVEGSVSPIMFAPKFTAINLSCNRARAMFQLQNDNGQIQESGNLPATVSDLPSGNYQVSTLYHGLTMQKIIHAVVGQNNDLSFAFVLGAVRLETEPSGAEVHTANGNYLGQTPLLLPDVTPQTAQFTLSLNGYEPVSATLDIGADQTNFYSTKLVGVGYLPAIRDARTYLAASNYEAAAQAAAAALTSKPGDANALAIQSEANKYLDAIRQQKEKEQRPGKWFDNLCSEYPDANLFATHELETGKSAADVAVGIVTALTNSPSAFKLVKTASPETDTYEIVAKQTDFLGVNERDCLIVVGSPGSADTQVRFKVLEFEVQHHLVGDNQYIPLSRSKVENDGLLLLHVRQGLQIVTDKVQKGIDQ